MNNDLTYIAILLDRSGSMRGTENDVIGGVNTFIDQQRKVPGSALITIAHFDTEYEVIYEDKPIAEARYITHDDFVPRGGTALADATLRLMSNVGAKLAAKPENERPGQVIMLVFSDGHENSSKEARLEQVRAAVKHQEEAYSWKFLFFGMDIDAAVGGGSLGMSRGLNVQKGGGGIMRGVQAASAYVGYSRLGDAKMAQRIEHSAAVDDAAARSATEDFADLIKSKEPK